MASNQNVLQLTQQTGTANLTSVMYAAVNGTTDTGLPISVLLSTPIPFTQVGSGAATNSVQTKLQQSVNLADFTGYDPTGLTDSSTALTNAMTSLGAAGGEITWRGACFVNTNLTLAEGITLTGFCDNPGQRPSEDYTPANFASTLIIGASVSISMSHRSCVRKALVLSSVVSPSGAFPLPFGSNAASAIAAFAGTAFKPNSNTADNRLEDLLILGFQYAYNGVGTTSNVRPVFKRVYGDCTNGIFVSAVLDVGLSQNCEFWPFTTVNEGGTTPALLLRNGTAFYTENNSTWYTWDTCFSYGYAIGHDVNGVRNVRQINCGADSTSASTSIGFQYRGTISNSVSIGSIVAGNGNSGVLVNTTADTGVMNISIIGADFHGGNSVNGYVNVVAGNVSLNGCVFNSNTTGHVNLQSSATSLSMVDCTHANLGSGVGVYGNSTAVAAAQIINPRNLGTFTTAVANQISGGTLNNTVIGGITPRLVTGSTVISAGSFVGPAAGYSITTTSGTSSGGTIQLFDASNGNQVAMLNNGTVVGSFKSNGFIPSQTLGIVGTTAANNANAGSVGEYIQSVVATGSAVSLTTATPANVTSISLTAGDWDVAGEVGYTISTAASSITCGINTTSAALPAGTTGNGLSQMASTATTLGSSNLAIMPTRISIAATTTVYLVAQAAFAAGTVAAFGVIRARRVR